MFSDDDLRRIALGWAADKDGFLTDERRLHRVARARRYKSGWVPRVYGLHYHEVWKRAERWSLNQNAEQ
jgi:hypothetical protein